MYICLDFLTLNEIAFTTFNEALEYTKQNSNISAIIKDKIILWKRYKY